MQEPTFNTEQTEVATQNYTYSINKSKRHRSNGDVAVAVAPPSLLTSSSSRLVSVDRRRKADLPIKRAEKKRKKGERGRKEITLNDSELTMST